MNWLEVVPAYGVDYTSQAQVKDAWNAHKDFRIVSVGSHFGQYINKGDAEGTKLMVRYAKLQKVMSIITP